MYVMAPCGNGDYSGYGLNRYSAAVWTQQGFDDARHGG